MAELYDQAMDAIREAVGLELSEWHQMGRRPGPAELVSRVIGMRSYLVTRHRLDQFMPREGWYVKLADAKRCSQNGNRAVRGGK